MNTESIVTREICEEALARTSTGARFSTELEKMQQLEPALFRASSSMIRGMVEHVAKDPADLDTVSNIAQTLMVRMYIALEAAHLKLWKDVEGVGEYLCMRANGVEGVEDLEPPEEEDPPP